ncbi:hypothetical protein FRC08_010428 [Ceratobasidium sp. 394]|nr:hypothetical protein FRC08_010428 [Ceratobasidium sp. 394]
MCTSHPSGFPLTEGAHTRITARSALEAWKAARALLTDTIASYLAACATLRTVCTAPSHQSIAGQVIEEALVAVDAELNSLEFDESALHDMRSSLATMRNQSSTLAPINSLPPEILARVFALSRIDCVRNRENRRCSDSFAGVCAYWRQIALDSTDLWSHIDIGSRTSEGLTRLLLERTKDGPIQMHVYEPNMWTRPGYGPEKTLQILEPLVRRIHTLEIESYNESRRFISRVLNLWLASGDPSLSGSLIVYRPHGVVILAPDDQGQKTIQSSSANAKMMLQSLRTLHLQNVKLDWDSGAYHGLVDLRLSFPCGSTSIPISHLANMLSTNPKLVVLKLGHLRITHLEGQSEPAPIELSSLKVLNLAGLEPLSLKPLLPLLLIPSSSVGLSVGLPADQYMRDELLAFLTCCPMATLYYVYYRANDVIPFRPSLLGPLPHISTLVLHQIGIYGTPAGETSQISPKAIPSPRLPNAILLSCVVTLEGLKELVSERGIQNLRLERCKPSQECQLDLHDIQTSLVEQYPGLWCYVSDTDSTSKLPCRTMFDH